MNTNQLYVTIIPELGQLEEVLFLLDGPIALKISKCPPNKGSHCFLSFISFVDSISLFLILCRPIGLYVFSVPQDKLIWPQGNRGPGLLGI